MRSFYEQMPQASRKGEYLVASGNAIRRNLTLRRILYDTFGKVVLVPYNEEEASLGAAILAGTLVEVDKSLADFQTLIKYLPAIANH